MNMLFLFISSFLFFFFFTFFVFSFFGMDRLMSISLGVLLDTRWQEKLEHQGYYYCLYNKFANKSWMRLRL